MILGDIDITKKDVEPIEPKIFLATPDRTVIAKLSEAYNIKHSLQLVNSVNKIAFDLPYEIDIKHELLRNRNVDLIKHRFLLKVEVGHMIEWYIITKKTDNMDDNMNFLTVEAMSLAYELKDKIIRDYSVESYNATKVLLDALKETIWNIGYIDSDFDLVYRSFEVSSKTVLDFVFDIARTYNAIVLWDTANRTIELRKPNLIGVNRGLKISYGKYLKLLEHSSDSDEMVTRLKVYGRDSLSIQRLNPTGSDYLEDFSYFMYPFKRDINRNVLESSDYMSDELCHAILDYSELIETKSGVFQSLLEEKEGYLAQVKEKENEKLELEFDEAKILDIYDTQRADDAMIIYDFTYEGSSRFFSKALVNHNKYVAMVRVSSSSSISIQINGSSLSLSSNTWRVRRVDNSSSLNLNVSGSVRGTKVEVYIVRISEDEFLNGTDNEIIEKYNLRHKDEQIESKQDEIDSINALIRNVDIELNFLKNELSIENNFTRDQIIERNKYIIVREWVDENYISDEDLYNDAKLKFEELRKPKSIINIDIVNFLKVIEERSNWDKIALGDIITIQYEKLNTHVRAKIIEIEFDHANETINLTIANIEDIGSDSERLMEHIKKSISTSTYVDMNKFKWNGVEHDLGDINKIINNLWDRTKEEIDMAINETVVIDRRGITIYDERDPNRFLRATHGILGITDDGGNSYKHAITSYGIVGERLYGKIITGINLTIGDQDGILQILGNKGVVTDRNDREVMWFGLYEKDPVERFGLKLENDRNQVIMDRDDGFKINKKNGSAWDTIAWLDTDGVLNAEGLVTKSLKIYSRFNEILFDAEVGRIDLRAINGWLSNNIELSVTNGIVVTRGDNIVKTTLNATEGIKIEKYENGDWIKKFFVDLDGVLHAVDLVATRLILKGSNGEILIDANQKLIDLNQFDLIIGSIEADNLSVELATILDGFINNLTVNHLKTVRAGQVGHVDYVDIKDNYAKWITAEAVETSEQVEDGKGNKLYWTDSTKTMLTTQVTPFPMYKMDYENPVPKLEIYFIGTGQVAYPVMRFGAGSGTGDRGRGFLIKNNDDFLLSYESRLNGDMRKIAFNDQGIALDSVNSNIEMNSRNYKVSSLSGSVRLEHSNGSFVEIFNNGNINISATNNINISAGGDIKISGNRIDIN